MKDNTKRLMACRPWLWLVIGMVVLVLTCLLYYSPLQSKIPREEFHSCGDLVNKSEFYSHKLKLVAATPGSGSDWTRLMIQHLTGIEAGSVGFGKRLTSVSELYQKVIYYKTHYPYQKNSYKVQEYLNTHPDKVVVLIRNPFDAAFSEYTRLTQLKKGGKVIGDKYAKVNELTIDDYLTVDSSSGKKNIPNAEVAEYFHEYFSEWKYFHKYWLEKYNGSVRAYLYNDLAQNNLLFMDIAGYFGYVANTNNQELQQCFLRHIKETKAKQRPHSSVDDEAKAVLKKYFDKQSVEAKGYVENVLKRKYQRSLII